MSPFSEMEWNSKWDWENLVPFCSKAMESPKKLQAGEWMILNDNEIDGGPFNLWGCGGNSGSDGGHVSSAKSSVSASTDCSSNLRFMSVEGFSGNSSERMEVKATEVSETCIGSFEPLIGLKLGKRTYFENSNGGGNVKTASSSAVPTPSTTWVKKTKSPGQNLPIPRCVVEGCNVDLSTAKEYHKKHRVCDAHSKCPKVVVGGLERRFCQQCSRFHNLAEFDEKKRSCRRRLSDHNARRRKPPQASPFCDGRQEMSFVLPRSHNNTTWNSLIKGCDLKSDGSGIKMPHNNLTSNNCMSTPGGSKVSPSLDAAQEYRRALSLLSSGSWVGSNYAIQPEGMPLSSPEFWQHSTNTNFQGYEAECYDSNLLN